MKKNEPSLCDSSLEKVHAILSRAKRGTQCKPKDTDRQSKPELFPTQLNDKRQDGSQRMNARRALDIIDIHLIAASLSLVVAELDPSITSLVAKGIRLVDLCVLGKLAVGLQ